MVLIALNLSLFIWSAARHHLLEEGASKDSYLYTFLDALATGLLVYEVCIRMMATWQVPW